MDNLFLKSASDNLFLKLNRNEEVFRNEDHYLAYECKWLCVNTTSGYDAKFYEYLTQGLMRYVSAKYAQNFPIGSMVGYIFDGKADVVNGDIQTYLSANAKLAKLLSLSNASYKKSAYFSSTHARPKTNIVVRLIWRTKNPI